MSLNFKPPSQLFAPLQENKNATLTFFTASGSTVDPDTGNIEVTTQPVEVDCILHPLDGDGDDVFMPGTDMSGERLRGRLVNPKTLPEGVGDRSTGKIQFDDGRSGEIELRSPTQNSYVGDALGAKFYLLYRER